MTDKRKESKEKPTIANIGLVAKTNRDEAEKESEIYEWMTNSAMNSPKLDKAKLASEISIVLEE